MSDTNDTSQSYFSIRSFASYLTHFKLRSSLMLVMYLIANAFLALVPFFIGKLVGVLALNPVNEHEAYNYVFWLIFLSIGHAIFWHGSEYLYMKLLLPFMYKYENIVFRQVIKKPYPFFVDKFTGKISSYVTTLGDEFRNFIANIFYNYANMIVRLVSVSLILVSVNWQTGALFVGNLILMLVVGRYTVRNNIKYEKISTDVTATKNGKIIDAIANFTNVKSFRKEEDEYLTIQNEQLKNIKSGQDSFFWSLIFWISMSIFVRFIIWPVTILLNVYLFMHHQITISELAIFLSSVLLFTDYVWGIIWNVSQFNLKLAKIEESYRYLFGPINIIKQHYDSQLKTNNKSHFKKNLELRNLSFAYPDDKDADVLNGVSLEISKNEKIGIVGKSGSGKTTLTKLLLGYYPVDKEQLLLDGSPALTADVANLISYVPQDTSLFHRSIAENIAYATNREVSHDDILAAAKQAHAHEFITQIPGEYKALVGERGVKLSAGQRQRIAIARAFLDDKTFLVLDEATSALDSESELLVQQALEKLWHGKTVIAIAHRLSTLRNMDRIIVFNKGKIVEQGSHQQLISEEGFYARLWNHQSGGFIEE